MRAIFCETAYETLLYADTKKYCIQNELNGSTASHLTCHANPRALTEEYSERIA